MAKEKPKNNLKLFENQPIRSIWNEEEEKWYFSVVDVVKVLTEQPDIRHAAKYWSVLKTRLKDEGAELTTNCSQLKMQSADGKYYKTDAADTKQLLRIIQSIPSKKAEPFKQWLAKVGSERIAEIQNPELAAKRMHELYKQKGYSEVWIEQRERGIFARNQLTDEWKMRGAEEGRDFAILTNEIYRTGFGLTAKDYKDYKGIKKQDNLRDSMTNIELALTNLGEVTAAELHREKDSFGMKELQQDVNGAGEVISATRKDVEKRLGHSVVSKQNHKSLGARDQEKLDR